MNRDVRRLGRAGMVGVVAGCGLLLASGAVGLTEAAEYQAARDVARASASAEAQVSEREAQERALQRARAAAAAEQAAQARRAAAAEAAAQAQQARATAAAAAAAKEAAARDRAARERAAREAAVRARAARARADVLRVGVNLPRGPLAPPRGNDVPGFAIGAKPLLSVEEARQLAGRVRAYPGETLRASSWTKLRGAERDLRGSDISWPQCPDSRPAPDAQNALSHLVVGVTHGVLFNPNPCLGGQYRWARSHTPRVALYVNVTYPSREAQRRFGGVEEATAAGMRYAVRGAAEVGAYAPSIFIDVEASPTWLTGEAGQQANAVVVHAALQELRRGGYEVGVYSSQSGLRQIVGEYLTTTAQAWVAVGSRGGDTGVLREVCGRSTTQGPVVMVQYLTRRFDESRVCPQ